MTALPWIIALVVVLGCIAYVVWLKRSQSQDRLRAEQQAKAEESKSDAVAETERDKAMQLAIEMERRQAAIPLDDWIVQQDAKRDRK